MRTIPLYVLLACSACHSSSPDGSLPGNACVLDGSSAEAVVKRLTGLDTEGPWRAFCWQPNIGIYGHSFCLQFTSIADEQSSRVTKGLPVVACPDQARLPQWCSIAEAEFMGRVNTSSRQIYFFRGKEGGWVACGSGLETRETWPYKASDFTSFN
jgi:hypothetical protein